MKPKVSIVVPIYNAEKYLNQCLDSLLNQTLREIEIILVNDGSTDSSAETVDKYAEKDSRIKSIYQPNSGVCSARNTGMSKAEGEYIGFVDADDWVEPEMFERLYKTAVSENADIAAGGFRKISGGKVIQAVKHPMAGKAVKTKSEISEIRKKLYGHSLGSKAIESFPMSVCNSVFKTMWLKRNGLKFQNAMSEDTVFNLNAYKYADAVAFTKDLDYCYRKDGQESVSQRFSDESRVIYRQYFELLFSMAAEENDESCIYRVKRTVIDDCRYYVGVADNSSMGFFEKVRYIKEFIQGEDIRRYWEGYPITALPVQQMIFQFALRNHMYAPALILYRLRSLLRK